MRALPVGVGRWFLGLVLLLTLFGFVDVEADAFSPLLDLSDTAAVILLVILSMHSKVPASPSLRSLFPTSSLLSTLADSCLSWLSILLIFSALGHLQSSACPCLNFSGF